MAEQSFSSFVTKERNRLTKLRNAAEARKTAADAELMQIENEFKAISAYETAKQGRPAPKKSAKSPKSPKVAKVAKVAKGPKRVRRAGRRVEVLAAINKSADGATRADLLVALKAKGNKSDEQSVSNALAALKKTGKVAAKGGRYHAA
jgi:hypothetical protein